MARRRSDFATLVGPCAHHRHLSGGKLGIGRSDTTIRSSRPRLAQSSIDSVQQIRRWHLYAGADELQTHATEAILRAAAQAIAARGRFLIVLAGGETPRRIYERLSAASTDWKRWQI